MSKIKVTATVTYDYDTEDGVVDSEDGALEDVQEMLDSGDVSSGQFTFVVQTACAWCGEFNMDTEASFNAKDICIDCAQEG